MVAEHIVELIELKKEIEVLKKEIEEILESSILARYLLKDKDTTSMQKLEKIRILLKQSSFSSDYVFIDNNIYFSPLFFDSLALQRIKESLPFGKVYIALFYAKDPNEYIFVGGRKVIVIPLFSFKCGIMIVLAIELNYSNP